MTRRMESWKTLALEEASTLRALVAHISAKTPFRLGVAGDEGDVLYNYVIMDLASVDSKARCQTRRTRGARS